MRGTRPAYAAVSLFLISVAVCISFTAAFPLPQVESDALEYLTLAQNVATGQGFTQDGEPGSYRPPLFSVLLGGWFRLTGTSSVYSAAVFQSLEHGLGVVFAFLLFLEVTDAFAAAFAASLFLAINPLLFTRVVFVYLEPT